jgi:hypothetical protein
MDYALTAKIASVFHICWMVQYRDVLWGQSRVYYDTHAHRMRNVCNAP